MARARRKIKTLSITCPHCGAVESRFSTVTEQIDCASCGKCLRLAEPTSQFATAIADGRWADFLKQHRKEFSETPSPKNEALWLHSWGCFKTGYSLGYDEARSIYAEDE